MKLAEYQEHILIRAQSRLDLQGGNDLQDQILAISPEHPKLWIIDLAQVEFIDSSGLGALIAALKFARKQGCRLVLCHPSPTIKLILEITQLDRVFASFDQLQAVFSTYSEALSA